MKRLQSPFLVMPLWSAIGVAMVTTATHRWMAVGGLLAWPAVEYVAHRWLMHGTQRWAPRLYKRVHGVHHLYPNDLAHFTVPIPAVAIAVAVLLVVGLPRAVIGGLLVAYVVYDLAHLAAHGKAPFPFRGAVARHHAAHHRDDAIAYGVTSALLDKALGTMPSSKTSDDGGTGEALRVVLGSGPAGVAAFRDASSRGGKVFACAPVGSPLAVEAGAANVVDGRAGSMIIVFADEVIDTDATPTQPACATLDQVEGRKAG